MPLNLAKPGNQVSSQPGVNSEGIVITSSRAAYFIGETETFKASATSPSGSDESITGGAWTSDTPDVATVNDAGLVTIVGQGWANISCAFNGLAGSKQVWGRADCRGTWSGTYSIQRCEIQGNFAEAQFCETHGGSGLPIDLVVIQEGEVLRGTIALGGLSTPFVAKPLLDGSLEMEGEIPSDPFIINVAVGCDWTPSGPRFSMMLYYSKGDRMSGQAMLTCNISLSKTGAWQ